MFKSGIRACLLVSLALLPACRKNLAQSDRTTNPPPLIPALVENRLGDAPAGLLGSRAASPVHWQPWDPAILAHAAEANRLIFVFIGSARYPSTVESLNLIDKDAALVARLNSEFVPVLVDIDLCPEAGLAAGVLSQEIRTGVSFPFLLFLSPEGNEVTWRTITGSSETGGIRESLSGAMDVVAKMWADSPDYVIKNSRVDHQARVERLLHSDPSPADAADRDQQLTRAIRQLVSLYDEDTSSMSGAGGLLPLGIVQTLASAALDPATAPDLAKRCRTIVSELGTSLWSSAIVDPLDGGVYPSRFGPSWDLPMIYRNCATQARVARALATVYRATGDQRPLQVALGAVKFAEERYASQDGLFAAQRLPGTLSLKDWLWTQEQVEKALSPQEAALWKALCGINSMGNLAMESDPLREYFRLNSLASKSTLPDAAKKLGLSTPDATALYESGRKKLLEARTARQPDRQPNPAASASASFRMVSAYAALFTATADPAWRTKALALAERTRKTFGEGTLLKEANPGKPAETCEARAFTHALAIQAALDLAEITLDENWRIWAGDLSTSVAEAFVDNDGRLREARQAVSPLSTPFEDRMMLFDDSTAGLMRMNLARLQALGQSPPPALVPWLTSLPPFAEAPVVFTDSILAASFARSRVIVELPENASPEWREAACKLPLDRIGRRLGKVTAPKLLRPDGSQTELENPAALEALARPVVP
ncbi:DUF255 domain-containing protein [Haloferula sp. BvORR071]|uniref:DUF255 domain-containing protein n=1 Tax=Haloferula sp. BvORR071 TaxID=1396141 RepID=UPI002240FBDD|nr:DUF255 domain-containing protein [Haloferula sp. BvORR071]